MDITIRAVRPEEHTALGEVTARAYLADGLLEFGEADEYLVALRDVARRAAEAEVLVAVDDTGRVLGGVALAAGAGADLAGAGEAEIRMLAVDREARGRGAGEALVRACVDRARAVPGCRRVVLSSHLAMAAAQRLYRRVGFDRTPARDWAPLPGVTLHTYGRDV
ncbi:GNAT family N-acetyltransferase [Streptomyces lichenis]|uniref:GNAT family N-acetyltransferase n=1 Tax=Streptomyces lichenis TaxID=2306967 RepID=A0ABT0I7P3_9ACTN|nr:GNAT family N-acetyltransferase [Streptomyces lichenis]MCK8677348.1 GNAT family N-acetyltransferase [Streptomyces lichenis]